MRSKDCKVGDCREHFKIAKIMPDWFNQLFTWCFSREHLKLEKGFSELFGLVPVIVYGFMKERWVGVHSFRTHLLKSVRFLVVLSDGICTSHRGTSLLTSERGLRPLTSPESSTLLILNKTSTIRRVWKSPVRSYGAPDETGTHVLRVRTDIGFF